MVSDQKQSNIKIIISCSPTQNYSLTVDDTLKYSVHKEYFPDFSLFSYYMIHPVSNSVHSLEGTYRLTFDHFLRDKITDLY